jgi:hypothetical protein
MLIFVLSINLSHCLIIELIQSLINLINQSISFFYNFKVKIYSLSHLIVFIFALYFWMVLIKEVVINIIYCQLVFKLFFYHFVWYLFNFDVLSSFVILVYQLPYVVFPFKIKDILYYINFKYAELICI